MIKNRKQRTTYFLPKYKAAFLIKYEHYQNNDTFVTLISEINDFFSFIGAPDLILKLNLYVKCCERNKVSIDLVLESLLLLKIVLPIQDFRDKRLVLDVLTTFFELELKYFLKGKGYKVRPSNYWGNFINVVFSHIKNEKGYQISKVSNDFLSITEENKGEINIKYVISREDFSLLAKKVIKRYEDISGKIPINY